MRRLRLYTAIGFGTFLGLTAAHWLEYGRLTDRPPTCVEWTRGGSSVFCTGWSD